MRDAWLTERFNAEWVSNPLGLGVAPGSSDVVYATDYGRTLRTLDGGASWQAVYSTRTPDGGWTTNGLDVTTSYGVHFDPFDTRRVFISYSSEDRHFVLEKVRALEEADIQCFFDVESLRSGDHWEKKLKENIASSDLVMLFWSPAAAASKWVLQEARWAMDLQSGSPTAEPDIKPYHVTGQRTAPPPPELAHLHFASAGGVATHSFVKTSA